MATKQDVSDKMKWTIVDRRILTPAEMSEVVASHILRDVVYGKSPHADALEAEAGELLVEAAKIRLSTE